MKICVKCKESLSLDRFSKNKAKKDGLATMCKTCWNAYYQEYYQSGKERQRILVKNKAHKQSVKALLDSIKSIPCKDCGGTFPVCCMDFDHRDPSAKSFTIAAVKHRSVDAILAEVTKCDVVCANCHRIRHSSVV